MHRPVTPKHARSWFRLLRSGHIVEPCGSHRSFHIPSFASHELAVGLQLGNASRYASTGRIDPVDSANRPYETREHTFLYQRDL